MGLFHPRCQNIYPSPLINTALLEHFKIFCSSLGRREDKAGKEDCAAILKYCE
jgi:hypothetical protein